MKVIGGEERLQQLKHEIFLEQLDEKCEEISRMLEAHTSDPDYNGYMICRGIIADNIENNHHNRATVVLVLTNAIVKRFPNHDVNVYCNESNNNTWPASKTDIYMSAEVKKR